jgi:hypothetical protein
MFTTIDKALIALIMGGIFIWNAVAPWQIGVSPETVQTIVGILTPVLVYLIPNKERAQ